MPRIRLDNLGPPYPSLSPRGLFLPPPAGGLTWLE
jgi:hypothetical protein